MEKPEVEKVLDMFTQTVVGQARRFMTLRSIGSVRKNLYDSFRRHLETVDGNLEASISSDKWHEYGKFVNYGVRGIESGRSLENWSFKSKGGKRGLKGMPPPSAFKRDKLHRIVSDNQAFATAVTVFKQGLEPTEFFTKPFEIAYEKLPNQVIEAYGLDFDSYIKIVLNANLK